MADGSLGGFWNGDAMVSSQEGLVLTSSFRELSTRMAEAQKVLKVEVKYFTYTGKTSQDFDTDSVENKNTFDLNQRIRSVKPQLNKNPNKF